MVTQSIYHQVKSDAIVQSKAWCEIEGVEQLRNEMRRGKAVEEGFERKEEKGREAKEDA
jgi:hypothetical protein